MVSKRIGREGWAVEEGGYRESGGWRFALGESDSW